MKLQAYLLSLHITSLCSTEVAIFTDWRQDPPPNKKIMTLFIAILSSLQWAYLLRMPVNFSGPKGGHTSTCSSSPLHVTILKVMSILIQEQPENKTLPRICLGTFAKGAASSHTSWYRESSCRSFEGLQSSVFICRMRNWPQRGAVTQPRSHRNFKAESGIELRSCDFQTSAMTLHRGFSPLGSVLP